MAAGPEPFEGVVGGHIVLLENREHVSPSAKAFNDRYRKAHPGTVPTDYGALGYDGRSSVLTADAQRRRAQMPTK